MAEPSVTIIVTLPRVPSWRSQNVTAMGSFSDCTRTETPSWKVGSPGSRVTGYHPVTRQSPSASA